MKDWKAQEHFTMEDLIEIVVLLRDPEKGCPWDKVQTHRSIRKNFIEETYEAVDAIDLDDSSLLCEELGDVLLQVALHTEMEREKGSFSFEDVCDGICKKLISRHTHIFGDAGAATPEDALKNWEESKRTEKHREKGSTDLESVPACLPALMRGRKVAKRAAAHGFGYADVQAALDDLDEEIAELRSAVETKDAAAQKEELGDVLFSAANVSRYIGCDAEEAMTETTIKFIARYKEMERLAEETGRTTDELTPQELATLWARAKKVCAKH